MKILLPQNVASVLKRAECVGFKVPVLYTKPVSR